MDGEEKEWLAELGRDWGLLNTLRRKFKFSRIEEEEEEEEEEKEEEEEDEMLVVAGLSPDKG